MLLFICYSLFCSIFVAEYMIITFYHSEKEILSQKGKESFKDINKDDIIWVDLVFPSEEEKELVEKSFDIELFTRQEAEEIESSSKYSEEIGEIDVNSNFLILSGKEYKNEPVSFIIKNSLMVTQRNVELKSFYDAQRRLRHLDIKKMTGAQIFLLLFETRIDFDADFLEFLAREITELGSGITFSKKVDEDLLIKINNYQEVTMLLRQNIVDKQRIISSILKSEIFPKDEYEKIRIMIKDIGSLLEHAKFTFERLEYLQNTFMGLVQIEQNQIIKIFTVASVVFMPPTLIASIYGMNFQIMPELEWMLGYPFAIFLMLLSSGITLFIFKKKKLL